MALLQDDVWSTLFHSDAGCATVVDNIPSRSAQLTSCLLELERLNQELKSKLRDDFIKVLDGIGGISLSATPQPLSPSPTPPSRPLSLMHDTSFITEAYAWLLENIANPYPSSTVKSSLARRYNYALSAVNSWFTNARRRMGWTTLCRDYFNNCRADALDAAHRALVEEDPSRQLSADIIHAFISVKVATEDLYSSTLAKSTLASNLETVGKDISDQDNVPKNEQKSCEPKGAIEFSKASDADSQNQELVAQKCYPSPDHLPSLSTPSLDEFLPSDSVGLPPILAGRKRRFSTSEAARASVPEPTARPLKRSHLCSSTSAYLPSPTTSTEEFSETDQIPWPASGSLADSKTRKRRLSDADTIRSSKRARNSMTGPRLHAVSDPFPLSIPESESFIDEWFKTNFDALFALPPPVDVVEPDLLTQCEVELFNNYIIPENSQKPLTSPFQENQISSSTDLAILDSLLQPLESNGFIAPPEIIQPSTRASVSSPVSEDRLLLPDLSHTIDWTALLNGDPSDSISDPVFSYPYVSPALPGIDLSILQLPHIWTTVAS